MHCEEEEEYDDNGCSNDSTGTTENSAFTLFYFQAKIKWMRLEEDDEH